MDENGFGGGFEEKIEFAVDCDLKSFTEPGLALGINDGGSSGFWREKVFGIPDKGFEELLLLGWNEKEKLGV